MKATRSLPIITMAAVLLASCSQGEEGSDPEPDTATTAPTTEAPPEYSAPVLPGFEISGFTENAEAERRFALQYDHLGTSYQLDSTMPSDTIFVTSYLLPAEVPAEDYEDWAQIVAEYNEASANEVEDDVTTDALAHGYEGIFRYAVVRDAEGLQAYQRNFFIFHGQLAVQVTCQWQKDSQAIKAGCREVLTTLSIPNE